VLLQSRAITQMEHDKQKQITIDVVIPSTRIDNQKLSSITSVKIPPEVEVCYYVVVDNPGLSIEPEQWSAKIIRNEENKGAAMSRNIGFEAGSGDYVLFIDDDVIPNHHLIEEYLSVIKHHPDAPGYVGLTKFPPPTNSFTRGVHASDILTFFDIATSRNSMAWGTTSNLLVNRKAVDAIRFSSEFPKAGGGEDIDFCLRILARTDKPFVAAPKAIVEHGWWKKESRVYSRFFRWAYGDSRLPRLHPKHRFYNFPNMIETVLLGLPILFVMLGLGLLSIASVIIWIGLVILFETVIEMIRVKHRFPNSLTTSAIEATIIRSSNDLGRVVGNLRRWNMAGFFERFDYFTTKESIGFEREVAFSKFMLFLAASFLVIFL
jgi:GT2 family glycosyltransferase